MRSIADNLRGLFPSVNDILAAVVIVFVYTIRIVETTNGVPSPWYLSATTDAIIPLLAAAWIWVMAMYAAYVALGEP